MLKPQSTEEVSAVLRYCNENRLAVVPQGGRTGLVGGSVPVHDEVILNTQRMNRIIGFDESYGIVSAEAGCILSDVQDYAPLRGGSGRERRGCLVRRGRLAAPAEKVGHPGLRQAGAGARRPSSLGPS